MIEIPQDVERFSYGVIYDIVDSLYDEDETLDFKSDLTSEPEYIAKTCCAFTNTKGGVMIFGVNNDRKQKLTTDQRMTGLEDSDDLKVKIINQIKSIKPNIPIGRVIFKKSNIKCTNDKVLVILKILESNIGPHQYNGLCYKRIGGRNDFMQIDEITEKIIESSRNRSIFGFFMVECGLLKSKILDIKESIEEKGIHYSLLLSRSLETTAINHFLYHQSHLYPKKVGYSSMRLLEVTTKLRLLSTEGEDLLKEPIESQKKTYKGTGSDNATEFLKHNIKRHVELALLILDSLEKSLGDKFPKTQDFDQTIQEFKS